MTSGRADYIDDYCEGDGFPCRWKRAGEDIQQEEQGEEEISASARAWWVFTYYATPPTSTIELSCVPICTALLFSGCDDEVEC